MGRSICDPLPVPRIIRPSEESSSINATDAAVVAIQNVHNHQQEKLKLRERFHKTLQYRMARMQYEKRRAAKDRIPRARPEAMEITSMGVLLLRHRAEYEERGQANQYFNDVWRCAMEMERRQVKATVEAELRRRLMLKHALSKSMDRFTERTLRLKLAWGRQADSVAQHMAAVARKRNRLDYLMKVSDSRDLEFALLMVRFERLHKQGLRIPWLCSCRHGVSPWSSAYVDYCDKSCSLYHNDQEHQRRLLESVKEIIKTANTLDARVLAMLYGFRTLFEDPDVVEKREEIWSYSQSLERSRFLKALQQVHIEKMQREGVVVSPLCDCKHGVYPLDPAYWKRCHYSCPLYNNPDEYNRRLLAALESALTKLKKTTNTKPPKTSMVINVRWKPNVRY